jgi:hypothetical protein
MLFDDWCGQMLQCLYGSGKVPADVALFTRCPANDPTFFRPSLKGPNRITQFRWSATASKWLPSGLPAGMWTITPKGKRQVLTWIFESSWLWDRCSNGISLDEPMSYFATCLGYETLQMPLNGNVNSLWAFEVVDLRFPEDHLPALFQKKNFKFPAEGLGWKQSVIRHRKYTQIRKQRWTVMGVVLYQALMGNVSLSIRDPFDPSSQQKALACRNSAGFPCTDKCVALDQEAGPWKMGFCKADSKLSQMSATSSSQHPLPVDRYGSRVIVTDNNNCFPLFGPLEQDGMNAPNPNFPFSNGMLYCQGTDGFSLNSFWKNLSYGSDITGGPSGATLPPQKTLF